MGNKPASAIGVALPPVDLHEAQRFLDLIAPGEDVTFQTFPDADNAKKPGLARVLHGRLEDHAAELAHLNANGAGIFVMVNAGDGLVHKGAKTCRTAANVVRVRAVFVDLDGAPLAPVVDADTPPQIVVESSPAKWHAYWLVSDCPPEAFRALQAGLAARFNGDTAVVDLPRVLRLPGFVHQKSEPFTVRLAEPPAKAADVRVPYMIAELQRLIAVPDASVSAPATVPGTRTGEDPGDVIGRSFSDGQRTQHLVQLAGRYFAKGLGLDEVTALARGWNSRNTPPLDDEKVVSTCASMQQTHLRKHPASQPAAQGGEVIELFPIADARVERFIANPPPPRRWLLKECLPRGKVGALIAPGGTGKSQFLLQLAVSVATGEPFLGLEIDEPGGVLCLFAEDDEDEIHRRLHNITQQFSRRSDLDAEFFPRLKANLHLKSMVGRDNLMTSADRVSREVTPTNYAERLLLAVREIPDIKLIVIDPGSRFRGGDENTAQDTTRFIEVLELVVRRTGANLLVAHHANKGSMSGGDQGQGSQRGSSAFSDGVRWQLNLSYLSDKEMQEYAIRSDEKRLYLTATVVKNNYGPPGVGVLLRRGEEGLLAPADLSKQRAGTEDALLQRVRDRIRVEARAGATYTRTKFEDTFGGETGALKIGKVQLRELLKKWVKEGKLFVDKKRLVPDDPIASRRPEPSDKKSV
ncbi:MAG: AAA family ATPase [Betaproteobacteria bacterium]